MVMRRIGITPIPMLLLGYLAPSADEKHFFWRDGVVEQRYVGENQKNA